MSNIVNNDFYTNEFQVVFNNGADQRISPQYFLDNYKSIIVRYISDGNPSEDTKKSYYSTIDQYLLWCKSVGMDPFKIEEQHILYYRSILINNKFKPATVKFKLTAIRRFYFVAIKYKLLSSNPAEDIHAQRDPDAYIPVIKYLTIDQLQKLLDSLDERDITQLRSKVMIILMAVEGLRTVEVHRMNVEDIDFNSSMIYIRGKGHNDMIYPTQETMRYLAGYINNRTAKTYSGETPVFTSTSNNSIGKRISRVGIRNSIDKALLACNLKAAGNSCHMLRHTCGTLLYAESKDLQAVKSVLRHRNIEMTSRYSHVQDAMNKRFTESIPINENAPKLDGVDTHKEEDGIITIDAELSEE